MDSSIILKIGALLLLVLVNGFFVAAEFALVKIRETQLTPLISGGNRRAGVAQHILRNLDSYLSATQLGITLASLALGWIGEPLFSTVLNPVMNLVSIPAEWRHGFAFVIGVSFLTFFHVVVGEQAPKWLAIQKPLATTLWVAYPMYWFRKASTPFVWLLNRSAQWLLERLGLQSGSDGHVAHSEDELRLLVATSSEKAGSTRFGRDVVLNALDLRRRVVRDVMRPRKEIIGLNTEWSISECLSVAEESRYSRLPLCEEGDVDRTLGVVHFKDLFAMRLKIRAASELRPVVRRLIYFPETARLEKVLQLFLEHRLHFAIVVDEYGGTVGMITLENVLEELVGEIQDEFDQEKPLAQRKAGNIWELDGALPLHDLASLIGQPLEEDGISTASGWITHMLGGFPKVGDLVDLGPHRLRVEEMDGLRVARLTLEGTLEPGKANPAAGRGKSQDGSKQSSS